MAAANAVFQSLIPGDHVVVAKVFYWRVRKWLAEFGLTWGLDVEFVDTTDGGGPSFRMDGPFPLYERTELDAFATVRLGPLRTSTSDQLQAA